MNAMYFLSSLLLKGSSHWFNSQKQAWNFHVVWVLFAWASHFKTHWQKAFSWNPSSHTLSLTVCHPPILHIFLWPKEPRNCICPPTILFLLCSCSCDSQHRHEELRAVGKRAEVFMAQQWAVPLGATQYWRALMKYIGTSMNHCLSDYKMAVLKWLPGPAKTPSSYIPLVSHHFQSAFRGWEMIYARSLNRSKIKPLCVWVICQHPNHWATPGNPVFVMLAIYSTGYSNTNSCSYTSGISLELSGQISGAALKRYMWETDIIFICIKLMQITAYFSLKSMGQRFSVRPH